MIRRDSTKPRMDSSASQCEPSKKMTVIITARAAWPMQRNDTIPFATTDGMDITVGHTKISTERKKIRNVREKVSVIKVRRMERLTRPENSHEKKRAAGGVFIDSKRARKLAPLINRSSIKKAQHFIGKYREQAKTAKDEFLRVNFQSYISRFTTTKRIEEMDGDQRLNLIEKLIRMFLSQGIWKMQMRFINACNNVNLRNILGDSYVRLAAKICSERGWDIRMASFLNVIAPRRGGKTTVAGAVFAAYLIAIPGFTALNTAGGRKMAGEFLHIVGHFISKLPDVLARSKIMRELVVVKSELDPTREARLICLASQGPGAIAVCTLAQSRVRRCGRVVCICNRNRANLKNNKSNFTPDLDSLYR